MAGQPTTSTLDTYHKRTEACDRCLFFAIQNLDDIRLCKALQAFENSNQSQYELECSHDYLIRLLDNQLSCVLSSLSNSTRFKTTVS